MLVREKRVMVALWASKLLRTWSKHLHMVSSNWNCGSIPYNNMGSVEGVKTERAEEQATAMQASTVCLFSCCICIP